MPSNSPVKRRTAPASNAGALARTNKAARKASGSGLLVKAAIGAGALAALALANHLLARRAERKNPPRGKFITVDGVRLHYLEQGSGPAVVLLHGNGVTAQDFVISGIFERLATHHRVIAFDRPGFGFSSRPRGWIWTADQQAALLENALHALGVVRPVIVGHSWGTLVALGMGLRAPRNTKSLVLLSGYYFPTLRADAAVSSWPAVPILGDGLRYTVSPLAGRLLAPVVYRKLFAPSPVTARFQEENSTELAVRPSQIRASAAEAALMVPSAAVLSLHYADLSMPVAIVAGTQDKIASFERQSERLAGELKQASLHAMPQLGHMLHHICPDEVVAIIEDMARSDGSGKVAALPGVDQETHAVTESHS